MNSRTIWRGFVCRRSSKIPIGDWQGLDQRRLVQHRAAANVELATANDLTDPAVGFDFVVLDDVAPTVWPKGNVLAIHVVNTNWLDKVSPVEAPPIPTVVAANTPNVAFSIPVEGPVVLAPITHAAPPPVATRPPAPSGSKVFTGKEEGGSFPQPSYPQEAAQKHMQGTVTNLVVVDVNGVPSSVETFSTSGHFLLDDYSRQWIKRRWRWLPGPTRTYLVPFTWQLQ